MNNVKLKEEKNILFIKKGIILMRYYVYYIIFAHILLLIGGIVFQNDIIPSLSVPITNLFKYLFNFNIFLIIF